MTVINKTADNITPSQTIVLNTYVTKKSSTKKQTKKYIKKNTTAPNKLPYSISEYM